MRPILLIALIVAIILAITLFRAARNEARAEADYPPFGEIIEVEGNQVHVLVKGTGPDLVLIHGSSGNLRDFTHSLVDKLTAHYRVIVFDRPGLGYTDPINPQGATIFEQAALLQKAAAQLGADKPVVMGQSYGGSVALAWAIRHPDNISALVTVSAPALPWDSELSRFYKINSHPIWGRIAIPLLTAWVSETRISNALEEVFAPQAAPEGYAEHFGPGLTLRRSSLRANALQRANLLSEIKSMQSELPSIAIPHEILHGNFDTTVSLDIHAIPMSEIIPTANLVVMDGIGHMPQHVAQDDVIAAIDRASKRAALH